ncbi:hypothetical protein A2866_03695 [Candidatus Roizmanbacteria bacterium RIFCSPHIGHO2_01_FULL_39_8]|nr:MAG: hypothetical protein A2866_03695 [Candidatus Roizmanbacteria bacterium RIFCSPHIGHO2_01_FULL_39_8]
MIHVIEHIDNPKEMIKKAVSLLSKGGVLYIETPNLDSHLFRAEKYQYTFLTPPDHIWIFSQYSFQKMFEKVKNISVGQISTYSDPVHFMGILKKKLGGKGKGFVGKIESKKIAFETSNTQPQKSNIPHIKYLLFDKLLAPIFTPILNISRYGTILELYVGKK